MRKYLNKLTQDLSLDRYRILDELQHIQFKNHDEINNLQKEKLSSLLLHSFEIPYYRRSLKDLGITHDILERDNPYDILAKLPILSRDLLRDNYNVLSAYDHKKRGSSINYTGGSTGIPVKFLH